MIKNYLQIAWRSIKKHKVYSFINMASLVVGTASFILIMFYIQYELSYDGYHKNANEIYKVTLERLGQKSRESTDYSVTPGILKSVLKSDFPEVLNTARVRNVEGIIDYKNNPHVENRFFFADPELLEIFTFPLLSGDKETALKEPFSVLLTQEMAIKYFGNENPIGETLSIEDFDNGRYDYKITGILKNVPSNSHFKFDFLASFSTLINIHGENSWVQTWQTYTHHTYILLPKNYNYKDLENKFPELVRRYLGEGEEKNIIYHLESLTNIHLSGNRSGEIETNSDFNNLYFFSVIAFLILGLACFNYINLYTALSTNRLKEVGIRKVVGADRTKLIQQFLCESMIFIIIALFISILLVSLLLPSFGLHVEKDLSSNFFSENTMFLFSIFIMLFIGIGSSFYPALLISSFKPVKIIKGIQLFSTKKSSGFRNSLVVIQFVISIVMIICTVIIYSQLNFIKNRNLGFKKDQIVSVDIRDSQLCRNYEPLKNELIGFSHIHDITVSSNLLVDIKFSNTTQEWEGNVDSDRLHFYCMFVDYNFVDFYNIKILAGRSFLEEIRTDLKRAFLINKTAAEAIGWEDPISKKLSFWYQDGVVIGVLDDIHFLPLHMKIKPMVISLIQPNGKSKHRINFSIKISSVDIPGTLAFIKEKFKEFSPDYPFEYSFLDDKIDRMYRVEHRYGQSFVYFTSIAIFLACLGLVGMASFASKQKTKEIGIRKVYGASVSNIVWLLSKNFLVLMFLGNLIAWAIAYYAMNKWLQNFAYHINIGLWMFTASLALGFFIVLFSVSYQSIKAATANPVDSLRYE